MKKYQASAWRGHAIGAVETCKVCSMRVIKYRAPDTGRLTYASLLGRDPDGMTYVRCADGVQYALPPETEVVWIRDFGGVKAMESL